MENQYKASSMNVKVVVKSTSIRGRCCDVMLRILVVILTFVVVIVVAVDKETETISVTIISTLPSLRVPVTAKWQYMSAFVYLVASNAIACSYAAASVAISVAAKSIKNNVALALTISDLIMAVLLFSANGAAAAIAVIGLKGNSHVQWHKVCDMFKGFCHDLAAGILLSLLASFVFLWLVVLAVFNLHKKSS